MFIELLDKENLEVLNIETIKNNIQEREKAILKHVYQLFNSNRNVLQTN